MGLPMAGHLVHAGHEVMVWNRTPGKVVEGASQAGSLEAIARSCETVILCVNRSEDVAEVLNGLVRSLESGVRMTSTIVDHSTIAPKAAQGFYHQLKADGIAFIDGPITGGSMGAVNGTLTIFCGGDEEAIERAKPYLEAYGKRIERVGGPGMGQMMKMANQIAVGGSLQALCECLAFADKAGLDLKQAKELIGGGAAGSWAFDNYGPKILNKDWSPGFSVKNQRKDFAYAQEAAKEIGAKLPGTDLVDSLLATLQNEGRGEDTTAALFDVLNRS